MNGHQPSDSRTPGANSMSTRRAARFKAAAAAGAVALAGAAVIGTFWVAADKPTAATSGAVSPAPPAAAAAPAPAPPSPLEVDHVLHEFGDVPINGGIVEATFVVTNAGEDPAGIVAAYTSCMCTTATLAFPDGTAEGPFGMPGHDLPVTLDRELGGLGSVTMTVRFDPGAHGPDATGPVERGVVLHTADGAAMTVRLTANVVAD